MWPQARTPASRTSGKSWHGTLSSSPARAVWIIAAAVATAGCSTRSPAVGGYATAYAPEVPAGVYGYPHVWFDGGYAYLVGDRWYYPMRGTTRWVVLRAEPPELYRYRYTYRKR
jgi:hypothetical protein